jgi:hypothetical protein
MLEFGARDKSLGGGAQGCKEAQVFVTIGAAVPPRSYCAMHRWDRVPGVDGAAAGKVNPGCRGAGARR